jgi:outer membrane protein OmpA-like peptidoglycan-associated protein
MLFLKGVLKLLLLIFLSHRFYKKFILLKWIIFQLSIVTINAQTRKFIDTAKHACNCNEAKFFKINSNLVITHKKEPKGFDKQEFNGSRINNISIFEKEHNSSWYQLKFYMEGNFCFTIMPTDTTNDFDYMLFQKKDTNFCRTLNKQMPLRVNLANVSKTKKGETGLNDNAQQNYVVKGSQNPYSASLKIDSGQTYYLVIDNLSNTPKPYQLNIKFEKRIKLSGAIKDSLGNGLVAEISITGITGNLIKKVATDSSGKYNIDTTLNQLSKYLINVYNKKHFTYSAVIDLISKQPIRDTNIYLPALTTGGKYKIGSINFYGGSPKYIPFSVPALENLTRMMLDNPDFKIKITGHVNGCISGGRYDTQELSVLRAKAIKDYLVDNKIKSNRIKTDGMGCRKMIYPHPENLMEEEANRRVEIEILK